MHWHHIHSDEESVYVPNCDNWCLQSLHCGLESAYSLDASHCIEVLRNAIAPYDAPEIINSGQGYQFTCKAWIEACSQHPQMRVSIDGRSRAKDNIWIERFWKTIKCEYIYILPEENGAALYCGIKRFIDNYNYHRRHQGIDRQVPSKLYIRPEVPLQVQVRSVSGSSIRNTLTTAIWIMPFLSIRSSSGLGLISLWMCRILMRRRLKPTAIGRDFRAFNGWTEETYG